MIVVAAVSRTGPRWSNPAQPFRSEAHTDEAMDHMGGLARLRRALSGSGSLPWSTPRNRRRQGPSRRRQRDALRGCGSSSRGPPRGAAGCRRRRRGVRAVLLAAANRGPRKLFTDPKTAAAAFLVALKEKNLNRMAQATALGPPPWSRSPRTRRSSA